MPFTVEETKVMRAYDEEFTFKIKRRQALFLVEEKRVMGKNIFVHGNFDSQVEGKVKEVQRRAVKNTPDSQTYRSYLVIYYLCHRFLTTQFPFLFGWNFERLSAN